MLANAIFSHQSCSTPAFLHSILRLQNFSRQNCPSQLARLYRRHRPRHRSIMLYYYHHAGITYQENFKRINIDRASFASLPGELRNLTFASTLKRSQPITVTFDAATQHFHTPGVKRVDGRTPLEALALLSDLDHNICVEARSYFFANNIFQVVTSQSLTTDPDYVTVYIHFLQDIGDVGRRSLRWLRLTVTGDSKQHHPTFNNALKLWDLIADCSNLLTLDVFAEIDYFYMDQRVGLKLYLSTNGYPISNPWPVTLESIKNMTNL
jgi:hypothetical protein